MDLNLNGWGDGSNRLRIARLNVICKLGGTAHSDVKTRGSRQCQTATRRIQRLTRTYLIYGYITESRHTAHRRYR